MSMPQSTIPIEPGAVVRVEIRFTEGQRKKRRPAVVLSGDAYHGSRADTVVLALSSKMDVTYHGDCELLDYKGAGLTAPTKAKGVIETVTQTSIDLRYGLLTTEDFERIKNSVREILNL